MRLLTLCFSFAFFLLVTGFVSRAHAQISVTSIGSDPLRNQSLECLRFENSKKNKIRVTRRDRNTSKTVSRGKATRDLKRSVRQTNRRLKSARKNSKNSKRQLQRLQRKVTQTIKNAERIQRLRQQIENIDTRIADLTREKAIIQETQRGVRDCAKSLSVNGAFISAGGVFRDSLNREFFFTGYYFAIDNWDTQNDSICVRINGAANPSKIRVLSPNNCLQKDVVRGSETCFAEASSVLNDRYYVVAAFRNGVQDPGTCDPEPWRCSLAEAQSLVDAQVADTSYQLLGAIPLSADCSDL